MKVSVDVLAAGYGAELGGAVTLHSNRAVFLHRLATEILKPLHIEIKKQRASLE
jgi:hypothetical protein